MPWPELVGGSLFERFTQRVYQKLVNNDVLKPTTVQHNVKLKGKSGCEHQIDVYWEYEKAGNLNRVAIECKNYDSHVPIGKVRDFFGVLHDLNNVRGIIVSSKGYQEGAKKFAGSTAFSSDLLHRILKSLIFAGRNFCKNFLLGYYAYS
jgi:predicted helicase